jgi:hypothetical protein
MVISAQLRTSIGARQLRQAEVGPLGLAGRVEQDVAGLDIAVHDLQQMAVGASQRGQHVERNRDAALGQLLKRS